MRGQLRDLARVRLHLAFVACALLFSSTGLAQFAFVTNNGTITIKKYLGSGGDVVIPGTITSLPVTRIGHEAFRNCRSMTSIMIPASVTKIGTHAFSKCTGLAEVYFWGDAPNIGPGIFSGDNNVIVHYLPGTTGWSATLGGRPTVFVPYNIAINNGQVAINGYAGSNGVVAIPRAIFGLPVTSIGEYAFNRASLTGLVIPDGVTSIGNSAFLRCTSLTNVTLPDSVTNIASWAFSYCGSLTSVKIPDGITTIDYGLFYGCSSLTNIVIGNSVTSIMGAAFWNTGLRDLNIPDNVTSINAGTFASTSLAHVTIGKGLTNVGDAFYTCPFDACPNLMAITVHAGNSAYCSEAGVLFDKSQSTLIEYPRGLAGDYVVPASVTRIGNYAFYYCTELTGVYFKTNAPSLGSFVFSGDDNATVYYLRGTTGWSSTYGGRPAVLWNSPAKTSGVSLKLQATRLGIDISGPPNLPVILETSIALAGEPWTPVLSATLTNGLLHFTDPDSTRHPARFYRIRSP